MPLRTKSKSKQTKRSKLQSDQNTPIDKTVTIIFYKDTRDVWGVFSSEKKALKAINEWKINPIEFYYRTYTLNYRLHVVVPHYVSDSQHVGIESLADLDTFSIVDWDSTIWKQPMVRDNELPNST